eukprot:PLAT14977.1.p1 GENE.PLAT14977.1~~PLAT14977.1.p1  ORF type:complete len:331 (-),score=119.44 PLAT14977.1:114-1106(-)
MSDTEPETAMPAVHATKPPARTLVGRIAADIIALPWDKVLAALMSGLLLYVGAARIFLLTDAVNQVKLDTMALQNKLHGEMSALQSTLNQKIHQLHLEQASLEERILKQLRTDLRLIRSRLDDEQLERHSLDKRVAVAEIRTNLMAMERQKRVDDGAYSLEAPPDYEAIVMRASEAAAAAANAAAVKAGQTRAAELRSELSGKLAQIEATVENSLGQAQDMIEVLATQVGSIKQTLTEADSSHLKLPSGQEQATELLSTAAVDVAPVAEASTDEEAVVEQWEDVEGQPQQLADALARLEQMKQEYEQLKQQLHVKKGGVTELTGEQKSEL